MDRTNAVELCHALSSPSDFVGLCTSLDDFVTYFELSKIHLPNNCGLRGQNAVSGAKTGIRPSLALAHKTGGEAKGIISTYLNISQHISTYLNTQCELNSNSSGSMMFNVDSAVSFTFSPWFLGAQLKPNSRPGGQAAQFGFAATGFFGKLFHKNQSRMKIADPSLGG